ncbi:hypothetical protein [Stieleria varia]|uniref:Uncharacterized protein n=1 Tax=Stieleria varia TaxID=2528005 RepID=A0A5C6A5C2_9BACT|nr:hypothetical protein [Stieleria varia]TWT94570.1 hypothetical protein Pla52n_53910 [Stieleria varia]
MLAAPYFLFAIGIGLVLLGLFWGAIAGSGKSTFIDPRLSDEDIERQLNKSDGSAAPGIMMLIGLVAILFSVAWRMIRFFV